MWHQTRFRCCPLVQAILVCGFLTAAVNLTLSVYAAPQQGSPGGQGGQSRPIPPEIAAAFQEMARLFQQGMDALNKRDYDRAEQAFKAAYDKAATLNDRYSMGTMLDALGNVYTARGNTKQAIPVQTRAIELLRTARDRKQLARALINIGITYRTAGQLDRATAAVEESVAIWEAEKDAPGMATALLGLGGIYRESGQFSKAIATLQQVLQIRQSTNAGPRALADTHNDLGVVYRALARFGEAEGEFTTALTLAQAANSPDLYANILNNLGLVRTDQGRFAEAMDAHQKALALREKGEDPEAVARSLANLSGLCYEQGRYDGALFYARRALSIADKTGSKRLIAGQHTNLGVALDALGQRRKAAESYVRALALYDEIGDPEGVANAAYNLGHLLLDLGEPQRAMALFERALPVAERQGNARWVADTKAAIGMALDRLGRAEAALDSFLKAHRQFEKLGNPSALARSCNNLGTVYTRLNRMEEAARMYAQALALKERQGNAHETANSQANLAAVYMQQGQWEKAAPLLKAAVENAERVRDQIAAPAEVGAFQTGNLQDVYARYARVLVQLGRPEEALAQIERGRGQGLARQAAQGRTTWSGILPPGDARTLAEATGTLRQAESNLRAAEEAEQKLEASGADDASLRAAATAVGEARRIRDEAQQALSAARNEIAARRPGFRAVCGLDAPTPETFAALAKAHPDTLFLTWSVGPDGTVLFALRDKGITAYPLPLGTREVAQRVRAWRNALLPSEDGEPATDPAREEKEARALYDALFSAVDKAGLLSDPTVKRLVVIGDGPLRELPFAALRSADGKRLIERFPLSTGVSLRLLSASPASGEANTAPAGRGILCVADPGGGDARRTDSDLFSGFAPLPAARREGLAIAGLYGEGATTLVGDAATEQALLPHLAKARLLHFATHGYLDDRDGLQSGLLLALPKTAGENDELTEMPLLTAAEILERPLAAELAVLSACDTGQGEHSGGEGLMGLVWAFRAAGCPSVVASQWSVDDDATGRLMVRFYEGLRAGKRRDEALRDAMLAVKSDTSGTRKTTAPFFWAAFQLHGEGSPLGTGSRAPK